MFSFELPNVEQLESETSPGAVRMAGPSGSPGAASVADRLATAFARRIHARGMAGRGPDGDWRRNAPATIEAKGFDRPNVETGEMLDERHIRGVVASTDSEMSMTYGTGAADEHGVSDRDRAVFAHEGQSAQRIRRPFFGLNDGDMDTAAEIAGDEWDAKAAGSSGVRQVGGAAAALGLPAP